MPTQAAPNLLSWASDIEANTLEQAAKTARLAVVEGHVALIPDAHLMADQADLVEVEHTLRQILNYKGT